MIRGCSALELKCAQGSTCHAFLQFLSFLSFLWLSLGFFSSYIFHFQSTPLTRSFSYHPFPYIQSHPLAKSQRTCPANFAPPGTHQVTGHLYAWTKQIPRLQWDWGWKWTSCLANHEITTTNWRAACQFLCVSGGCQAGMTCLNIIITFNSARGEVHFLSWNFMFASRARRVRLFECSLPSGPGRAFWRSLFFGVVWIWLCCSFRATQKHGQNDPT